MAIGPNHITLPCCLNCLKESKPNGFLCPKCNLPVCDEMCAFGEEHTKECCIFSNLEKKIHIDDFTKPNPIYWSITTLRVLKMRKDDPKKYGIIERMMSHMDERARKEQMMSTYKVRHYAPETFKI